MSSFRTLDGRTYVLKASHNYFTSEEFSGYGWKNSGKTKHQKTPKKCRRELPGLER